MVISKGCCNAWPQWQVVKEISEIVKDVWLLFLVLSKTNQIMESSGKEEKRVKDSSKQTLNDVFSELIQPFRYKRGVSKENADHMF